MKKNYLHTGQAIMYQSRSLRKSMTCAEKILWENLRNRKFLGLKFRRQYTNGKFITDFYCPEKNLIVEVDGSVHDIKEQKEYDKEREMIFKENEFKMIRFRNNDIVKDLENTLKKLEEFVGRV